MTPRWRPAALALLVAAGCESVPRLERIQVNEAGDGFILTPSGRAFVPWGFNYDHDREQRLLEDYWEREWSSVTNCT